MLDAPTKRWLLRYRIELTIPLIAIADVAGVSATALGFQETGTMIIRATSFALAAVCIIIITGPMSELLHAALRSWRSRYATTQDK